jgi:8-oxo-dGTP diphosphatase
MFTYKYARPAVTVDIVLFLPHKIHGVHLLCIKRRSQPFKGQWALPGGFLEPGESTVEAACRELWEETNIDIAASALNLVGVFGEPDRDPREHVISIAYWSIPELAKAQKAKACDDAIELEWKSLRTSVELAFDHATIGKAALRLYTKAGYDI